MKNLKCQIEKKRKEMILKAEKYGLSSKSVVQVSQELDQLIYQYQKNR